MWHIFKTKIKQNSTCNENLVGQKTRVVIFVILGKIIIFPQEVELMISALLYHTVVNNQEGGFT